MASDISSVQRVFSVISQPDSRDPTCHTAAVRADASAISTSILSDLRRVYSTSPSKPLAGVRVGILLEAFPAELSQSVLGPFLASLERVRELGATLHSVSTPLAKQALSAYYVIAAAEASSNLARFDGVRYGRRAEGGGRSYEATRGEGFGHEVKKRLLVGSYALSAE